MQDMVREMRLGWRRFWALSWRWKAAASAGALFLFLVIVSAVFGGSDDPNDDTSTVQERQSATATKTAKPSQSPSATATPDPRQPATLVRVVDGDTIEVSIEGQTYKVRYIGIDTPETSDPNTPVECFGAEATAANQELLQGGDLRVEKDVSETDQYGRLLRYIWVGDVLLNDQLVRDGFAVSSTYPPDVKYQDQFVEAQQEARDAGRGLWAACGGADTPLTPAPTAVPIAPPVTAPPVVPPQVTQPPVGGGCDPSYPTVCIAPYPPDLDCGDIPYKKFTVLPPDPHGFDGNDHDGIGCES